MGLMVTRKEREGLSLTFQGVEIAKIVVSRTRRKECKLLIVASEDIKIARCVVEKDEHIVLGEGEEFNR